ncbi:MAG: PEGA domain-containing protein [Opitutales bacterium]
MKSLTPSLIAALGLLVSLAGCASFDRGTTQSVAIRSFPPDAKVYHNDSHVGQTPMDLSLRRKVNHEIRLEKEGYHSAKKTIVPSPNEKSEGVVNFGPMEDLGYYVNLEPSEVELKLKSKLVPGSPGSDPYDRMAKRVAKADEMLESGELTAEEHKYVVEQILEFFERNN